MTASILGNELENQKALAFERRLGFVLLHKDQVTQQKDRGFIHSISRQIQTIGGAFVPTDEQGKWLVDIEGRIHGGANHTKLQDKLVAQGEDIVRKGDHSRLGSFKLQRLADLVNAGGERELTQYELSDLQFLVHAAGGGGAD